MKKGIILVFALFCIVLKAQAVFFENTVDFSGTTLNNVSCVKIVGSLSNNNILDPFEYQHTLNGIPVGSTLDNASLSLSYSGNFDSWNPELWLVAGNNGHLLGSLSRSSCAGDWVSQDFNLNGILSSIVSSNPWELQVCIGDVPVILKDTVYLDKSVISGNYTSPVPEPASMMLFGSGLLGLVGFAGKKFGAR